MAIAYLLKANPLLLSKPRVENFPGNLRSIESIKFATSSRFYSVKVESSVNSTSVSTSKNTTDFDEHFKAIPSSKRSSSSTFEKTAIINSILKAFKWFKIPAVVIFLLLIMMCGRDSAWSRSGGVMGGDSFSSSSSDDDDHSFSSSSSDDDDHSYSSSSWSGWGHETSTPYSPPPHSSDVDDHSYSSWSGWGHKTSTPYSPTTPPPPYHYTSNMLMPYSSPPPSSSYHYKSNVVMPNNEPDQYMSHKSSWGRGQCGILWLNYNSDLNISNNVNSAAQCCYSISKGSCATARCCYSISEGSCPTERCYYSISKGSCATA